MIEELHVHELGVIADLRVVLHEGLTAITGETGAGKTLVVEALELLVGGRSDPAMVRLGATETVVEGRFCRDGQETLLARTVPRDGRTRSYLDAKMVPASLLEEVGVDLVDLHGQHAHQSLLRQSAQRATLDAYAGVDLSGLRSISSRISELDQRVAALGGDATTRSRELDYLRYELSEIESAAISSVDEDDLLRDEEEVLGDALSLRSAVADARETLDGEGSTGARELVARGLAYLEHHRALEGHAEQIRGLLADLDDATRELGRAGDQFEADPTRLQAVQERRELLRRLVRKHGKTLSDVLGFAEESRARVVELESSDEQRALLASEQDMLELRRTEEQERIGELRRDAARRLGPEVERHLCELALPSAKFFVKLSSSGVADDVEFLLAANRGEQALPLSKVASGGELARIMLAIRLVLTSAPPTLVFDEVDAGIGGEAAIAVGVALQGLGDSHQVLVVTHLAQVAAFADHQLVVEKEEDGDRTVSSIRPVEGDERITELSRMLAGRPNSKSARRHASELLHAARDPRKTPISR